jgi:hypothetical protein
MPRCGRTFEDVWQTEMALIKKIRELEKQPPSPERDTEIERLKKRTVLFTMTKAGEEKTAKDIARDRFMLKQAIKRYQEK